MEQIVATPTCRKLLTKDYYTCLWPNSGNLDKNKATPKLERLRALCAFIRQAPSREEKAYFNLSIPEIEEAIRRAQVHLSAGGSTAVGKDLKTKEYLDYGRILAIKEKHHLKAKTTAKFR